MGLPCIVCRTPGADAFFADGERNYFRCGTCGARFLDPCSFPSADAERTQYDRHENDLADAGYRRFLSRVSEPLLDRLQAGCEGLDYGCGPGPALAAMLEEAGHSVALFLTRSTRQTARCWSGPMISSHVRKSPNIFMIRHASFARLDGLLKPGGWLAVMTCFHIDDARFANWYYRLDPTHVVFYREETMRWLAHEHRLGLHHSGQGYHPDAQTGMSTALHEERLQAVMDVLRITGARSVADLGCGDGALLLRLIDDPAFVRLVGVEQSVTALGALRAALAVLDEAIRDRVTLVEGSMLDPHRQLAGFDAVVMVETIEHLPPDQLSRWERAVFDVIAPKTVIITTPNAGYNPLLGVPAHRFRHPGHKFEWDRPRFRQWAEGVAGATPPPLAGARHCRRS